MQCQLVTEWALTNHQLCVGGVGVGGCVSECGWRDCVCVCVCMCVSIHVVNVKNAKNGSTRSVVMCQKYFSPSPKICSGHAWTATESTCAILIRKYYVSSGILHLLRTSTLPSCAWSY